jgi:hypothetical protein
MLKHEGRNPHVVGRDRRALLSQLSIHGRVVVGRLLVGVHDPDPGLEQKLPQNGVVTRSLPAHRESRSQLADDDEGQPDGICRLDDADNV